MEERYEIRGKIGEGGLGAVYRGFDTRMNREVAIKRISTGPGDTETRAESTRQLAKEAGALASLQHPNIVTVYDVGGDEDGPYVVMELISGKTLDELIERAPLTWPDFRELALQTQEALIAAHELNLIHSDLKPSNLMLTWLPSGKFQIKIVDFGLATLAHTQSREDLESIEAVFGSIFFMPPEQFERSPLDTRSDLYSMGCVYYQALTGCYPFDGASGNEVMEAHLRHAVRPIQEVRAGIPLWACDWIMWLLNRYPQDRPESARDALSIFLKNDRIPNPPLSTGQPRKAAGPPKPRLAGQRPGSPEAAPSPTGRMESPEKAKLAHTSSVATLAADAGVGTQTAPQPLAPPEGFKPSVHTSLQDLPQITETQTLHTPTQRQVKLPPAPVKKPFKPGKGAKIGIAVAATLVILALGGWFLKTSRAKKAEQAVSELITLASKPGATEVPVNAILLRTALESLATTDSTARIQEIGRALSLAKATDGTDVDERIALFATKGPAMTDAARETLIATVLRARANPAILPAMQDFAASSENPTLVVAALQSIRGASGDTQADFLIKIIETTRDNRVRDAAEGNLFEILRKSKELPALVDKLKSSKESNVKPEIQGALQRLLDFAKSVPPAGR